MTKVISDTIIYSGNLTQSVPKTLYLDCRITPIERNAWYILRMSVESDGHTTLATYEQLRPYLCMMPYAGKASLETVARSISLLRLTRWLSLIEKRRAANGSRLSNIYILHDDPLTAFEAIRLDDEYLSLVCQSVTHASKTIRFAAQSVLEDIALDPFLSKKRLPSRLEMLLEGISKRKKETSKVVHDETKLSTIHNSEVCEGDLLRNQNMLISESESSQKVPICNTLRNPKSIVVSSSKYINTTTMINPKIKLPERFYNLKQTQQQAILTMLQHLDMSIQQQVFNEWNERCQNQTIRNPSAYLYGIIQKAYKGEFNRLVEPELSLPSTYNAIEPKVETTRKYSLPTEEDKKLARQRIEELKNMLNGGLRD